MPKTNPFERAAGVTLAARLREQRRFIQVLAGPRQVGKTTLVTQVLERLALPHRYASADDPGLRGAG
jgi:predicted AAA+ superfamily ATPase